MDEQFGAVTEVEELREKIERLRRELAAARRVARRSDEAEAAAMQRERAERARQEVRTAAAEIDAQSAWERAAELGTSLGRRIAEGQARLIAAQSAATALEHANLALSEGQAALALREADLRAVIESAIDCAIVTTDRDGLVLAWNPGARRLLGWDEDAARTMSLLDALAPSERPGGLLGSDVTSALAGDRLSREGWLRRQDGGVVWAGIEAMPLRADDSEEPVGVLWMLRDRDAAHAAEAARQESEARLQLALDAARAGVWTTDLGSGKSQVDATSAAMFGLSPDGAGALGAAAWLELIHPGDRTAVGAAWDAALAREDGTFAAEFRVPTAEGGERWVDSRAKMQRDPVTGAPLRIIGVNFDVTLRKQAQQALELSETRLRGVLDGMAEGFGLLAPDFTILEHNPEALRMAGRPREAIVGRSHWEVYPGTEDSELGRLLRHAMAARVPVSLEHCYAFEDGHALWLDMRAYPTADGALAVFWRDVTDRKRAEDALRAGEERYRALFTSIDSGFCVVELRLDPPDGRADYRILEANPAFYRQTGLTEAILGRWLREAAPALEEHWYEAYGRVAQTGEPERFEKDSALLGRWFDVYAFRIGRPEQRRVAVLFNDITARKRTESALRESEERQAFLLKLSDALRPLGDPEEIRLTVAQVLGRHLGASRVAYAENIGDTFYDVGRNYVDGAVEIVGRHRYADYGADIVAELRAGRTRIQPDIAADPRLSEAEKRALAEAGVGASLTVPLVKEGRLVAFLGVNYPCAHDFPPREVALVQEVAERSWAAVERARTEAALRASEARLSGFAENSADLLWIADAAGGGLDYLSPAFETIFGAPRDAVMDDVGKVRALVHPDDRAAFDTVVRRSRAGETVRVAYRVVRPCDGRIVHVLDTGFPVRSPDGAIRQAAGIVQDVTDQLRMAAELAERERHLRALVEGVPHLLWRSATHGRWHWASSQWTGFTGLSEAESRGHGWLAAVHPDDRARIVAAWEAVGEGDTFAADFRLRSAADGTWRWFRSRGIPLRADDAAAAGPPEWLGTSTDVDDQIRAKEALERGKDELEARVVQRTAELMAAEETLRQAQKLEAVGQLTGGIAHDFNNMLQGVAGALDMARRRMEGSRLEEAGRYLDAARDATGRAAGLTRRLLAFARRQRLDPRQVDADRLVRGMAEMLSRTMGPGIALELDLCDGRGEVLCDANELESALLNLCINARDAMPEGGRLVIATRDRRLTRGELGSDAPPGDFVEVSVADTGTGMPPEVRERVLEPFFTTKPLGQGTGLGLSQVYGFVRQSGGALRIESAPGRGTTVRLWLPLSGRRPEAAEGAEKATAQSPQALGTATLLLVDDETGVRIPTAERLRDLGYRVVEAPDGPSALRLLEDGLEPDLLVTDVGLPGGMDGVRLAEAVRQRRGGLPILFTTGYAAVPLPDDAEVIPKPYPLDILAMRVRTSLAAARRMG